LFSTNERRVSVGADAEITTFDPDTVCRAKGIVYLEELPTYRVVPQMVGKRSSLKDAGRRGSEPPRSAIVTISSRGLIDTDKLQRALTPAWVTRTKHGRRSSG
jgi:hypothetical protein